jgi:hypothetical protein
MLRLMFLAFGRAGIADFSTESAQTRREVAASRHQPCRERAEIRAIAIHLDATRHLLDIFLMQTFRCAMFARSGARVTSIDTGLVFFVWHICSPVCYFLISPQVSISLP